MNIIEDYSGAKKEYDEMFDEATKEKYKEVETLTNNGLNFYDAIASIREKGKW